MDAKGRRVLSHKLCETLAASPHDSRLHNFTSLAQNNFPIRYAIVVNRWKIHPVQHAIGAHRSFADHARVRAAPFALPDLGAQGRASVLQTYTFLFKSLLWLGAIKNHDSL